MGAMRFLVTGGAGFIGSNIVEELLRRGHSVRVLDNFSTGKRINLAEFEKDIHLIDGDIRNYHIVNNAVKGIEVILHQAALPSVPRSIADPITSNQVNIDGTLNILEAARDNNVRRIVFASSSSVYGDTPGLPRHEDMAANPLSPYAVSKLAGEKYCSVYSGNYGVETVALRYFNVFGPRQDPRSQYSAVIPKFISAMLCNQQPEIFGDGETSRDFTFVSNVAEANIQSSNGERNGAVVMNCAAHSSISLNELVNKINKILGKNITPVYREFRKGDIRHSYADITRAELLINYKPAVTFEEGLRRTVNYYEQQMHHGKTPEEVSYLHPAEK